jgi:predicted ester cyclase
VIAHDWSPCACEHEPSRDVNHQHHDPNDPRDLRGVEAGKTFAAEFREAFPDFHGSIDIQLAEGDMVATRFTSRGRHRGAFMGVEPTK